MGNKDLMIYGHLISINKNGINQVQDLKNNLWYIILYFIFIIYGVFNDIKNYRLDQAHAYNYITMN